MPDIKVIKDSHENHEGFYGAGAAVEKLPTPGRMRDIIPLYEDVLEQAGKANAPTLILPSIPLTEPNSSMFQAISFIYKTLRDFQDSHSAPKEIIICCEDENVFNMYMVVWNLYYAQTKDDRMNEGRWD